MYDKVLWQFKKCVRENKFIITLHADEELDEDGLSIYDVERAVLTGAVIERQKDNDKGEWKYLIRGQAIDKKEIIVVAKPTVTGKMAIITVYRDE